MKNNKKFNGIFLKLALALVLIGFINWPFLLSKPKINWVYILFGFVVGWSIGTEIVNGIFEKRNIRKTEYSKNGIFLSYPAIFIYVSTYIIIFVMIHRRFFAESFSFFISLTIFSSYFLFYWGLKIIKTRKGGGWGPLTGKSAVIEGIFVIILSLLILISRPLMKLFEMVN
ncbi:MAG: hypothetical protein AABX29_08490 [Nanoarchaeota archaeon]